MAASTIGANEDHAWAVAKRKPRRQYIGRPALLPNPRFRTPWTQLYASRDDRAFITTMGIDTSTFHAILAAGFGYLWNTRRTTGRLTWECGMDAFALGMS